MEEGKKSCYTCANFLHHYTLLPGVKLVKTYCGNCLVRRISCKGDNNFPIEFGCEKWKAVIQPANICEKILDKLNLIEKEIFLLTAILQSGLK